MRTLVHPTSTPNRPRACERHDVLSKENDLRRTFTTVLDATSRCATEGAVVVRVDPPVTRAQVQSAFDQIDEKHHLVGIALRFEDDNGRLSAILEPIEPGSRGPSGSP